MFEDERFSDCRAKISRYFGICDEQDREGATGFRLRKLETSGKKHDSIDAAEKADVHR